VRNARDDVHGVTLSRGMPVILLDILFDGGRYNASPCNQTLGDLSPAEMRRPFVNDLAYLSSTYSLLVKIIDRFRIDSVFANTCLANLANAVRVCTMCNRIVGLIKHLKYENATKLQERESCVKVPMRRSGCAARDVLTYTCSR
jgi:hypothetical protein